MSLYKYTALNNPSYNTLQEHINKPSEMHSTKFTKINQSLSRVKYSNVDGSNKPYKMYYQNGITSSAGYYAKNKSSNRQNMTSMRRLRQNLVYHEGGNNCSNIFNKNMELISSTVGLKVRKVRRENHNFTNNYSKQQLSKFFVGQLKQKQNPFNIFNRKSYDCSKGKQNDDKINRSLYKIGSKAKGQYLQTIQASQKESIGSKLNGWQAQSSNSQGPSFKMGKQSNESIYNRMNESNTIYQSSKCSSNMADSSQMTSQKYSLQFDEIEQSLNLIKPSEDQSSVDHNAVSINIINEDVNIVTRTQSSMKRNSSKIDKSFTENVIATQKPAFFRQSKKSLLSVAEKQSKYSQNYDEKWAQFLEECRQQQASVKNPHVLSQFSDKKDDLIIEQSIKERQKFSSSNSQKIQDFNSSKQSLKESKSRSYSNNQNQRSTLEKTDFNGISLHEDNICNLRNDEYSISSLIDEPINCQYTNNKFNNENIQALQQDFSGEEDCDIQEHIQVKTGEKRKSRKSIIQKMQEFGENCKSFFNNAIDYINPTKLSTNPNESPKQYDNQMSQREQEESNGSILQIKTLNSHLDTNNYITNLRNSKKVKLKDPTIMISQGWGMESIIVQERLQTQHVFKNNSKDNLGEVRNILLNQEQESQRESFDPILSINSQLLYESRQKIHLSSCKLQQQNLQLHQTHLYIFKLIEEMQYETLIDNQPRSITYEPQMLVITSKIQQKSILKEQADENVQFIYTQSNQISLFMTNLEQTIVNNREFYLAPITNQESGINHEIDAYFTNVGSIIIDRAAYNTKRVQNTSF